MFHHVIQSTQCLYSETFLMFNTIKLSSASGIVLFHSIYFYRLIFQSSLFTNPSIWIALWFFWVGKITFDTSWKSYIAAIEKKKEKEVVSLHSERRKLFVKKKKNKSENGLQLTLVRQMCLSSVFVSLCVKLKHKQTQNSIISTPQTSPSVFIPF